MLEEGQQIEEKTRFRLDDVGLGEHVLSVKTTETGTPNPSP